MLFLCMQVVCVPFIHRFVRQTSARVCVHPHTHQIHPNTVFPLCLQGVDAFPLVDVE